MRRLFLSLLACLTYFLSPGITLGNLTYNIYGYDVNGFGMAEVSCAGTWITGSVDIPGGISSNGTQFNVTRVAAGGFQACTNLTSVSLPPTIESVEERGFYLCSSLQTITFPHPFYAPLSFGKEAFSQCSSLTSIELPEFTISLGESIFSQCRSLTTIKIPSTTQRIDKYAFSGCGNLYRVYASSIENWCKLEIANFEASPFSHNEASGLVVDNEIVTTLEVPTPINKIGSYAFAGNKTLQKIIFNESLNDIGEGCFQYASNINDITSLSVVPPVIGSYCFDGINKNIPIHVPDVSVEAYRTATGWNEFTNYVPIITETSDRFTVNGVTYSATDMPSGECKVLGSTLSTITIPNNVLFGNTYYSVTKINEGAFENSNISHVELPSSLREIGNRAFMRTNLTEISIPPSTETIGEEAFRMCFELCNVYFGSGSLNAIGESAFSLCTSLNAITLPSTLRSLGNNAFRECSNLKQLEVNDGLTYISEAAFMATAIENLTLPESVARLYPNAFIACDKLRTVLLKTEEVFMDNGAFWHCGCLDEVCLLAENVRGTECKPFNKSAIKLYVNKSVYNLLNANNVWSDQEIIQREIIIPKNKFDLAVGMCSSIESEVQDASMIPHNLEWYSSDTNIFTYSNTFDNIFTGDFITGNNIGSATLTVKGAYGLTAERPVNVFPRAENMLLYHMKSEMNVGETDTIGIWTFPENGYVNPIWTSSDESVLSICEILDDGRKIIVAANNLGQSTITATNSYNNLVARCLVTVTHVLVKSITLSIDNWSGKVGDTIRIDATVLPDNAVDRSLIWSSSDESIASVDSEGNVTAINVGVASITAKAADGSGVSASCIITVLQTPVESISLDRNEWTGKVGETVHITATVFPENATNKSLTWTSNDENVAIVDNEGNISALNIGQCVITVSASDGSGVSSSCSVTVEPTLVESISLDSTEWTGHVNDTFRIVAAVFPENATNKSLTWTSNDENVAIVDNEGNVSALNIGQCVITVSASDGSGVSSSCGVTVEPTLVESISLDPTEWTGHVNDTFRIVAAVFPENATNKSLTWTSNDENVAIVDNEGNISALNIGQCVITVSASDGSGVSSSCSVTVEPTLVESISLDPTEWTGLENESFSIEAIVLPDYATNKILYWSSSNVEIASVNQNGIVSIEKPGSCIISATTTDGTNLTAVCIITSISGLDDIFMDKDFLYDVYDTNGALIKSKCELNDLKKLSSGIYIIYSGQTARKIFIRE